MILSREQINRYLRHIIIPEISGAGQKKLLESKVLVSAFDAEQAAALLFYVAALGIGQIECCFINTDAYEKLFADIKDLNGDVQLDLVDANKAGLGEILQNSEGYLARIAIGTHENMIELFDLLEKLTPSHEGSEFTPLIVAATNGWDAFQQVISDQNALDCLRMEFQESNHTRNSFDKPNYEKGQVLSTCLLGAMVAIECAKLCLDMGTVLKTRLCFDLLSMVFSKSDTENSVLMETGAKLDAENSVELETGTKSGSEFESVQEANPMQKELSECKVLIVGTGGLGSPAAFALAKAGVGTIGLIDYDEVEISNLNRQILHSTSRIGMAKVESAKLYLKQHHPAINIVTYKSYLTTENAIEIFNDYDVVLDCVDNFQARYLINDACYFTNKPLVDAAAVQYCGLILTIIPDKSACYRCVFPASVNQGSGMSCSEAGVLGPVPGVMGFQQATEAIKVLLGIGELLNNRIVYFDAKDSDFDVLHINKSNECDLCGQNPSIEKLVEYTVSCNGSKQEMKEHDV